MLMLEAPSLHGLDGVAHGFFGREGGVSPGIFASLNCGPGSGDAPENVGANRALAMKRLTGKETTPLVTLYQIHSAQAVSVAEPWDMGKGPKADAMATDRPNIVLGILAADCAPVLLADAEARVIGAAHAGWKGAFAGVIEQAIAAMEALGAKRSRIRAAIGPCIGQSRYEVGPEFHARFVEAGQTNARFFVRSDRAEHWRFDLEAYAGERLARAGVATVTRMGACTYTRREEFFSYRRATHAGETDYGRNLSAILLRDK